MSLTTVSKQLRRLGMVWLGIPAILLSGCGSNSTLSSASPAAKGAPVAAGASAGSSGAAATAANAPKAVFSPDAKSARDPFFPGSSRSSSQVAQLVQTARQPMASYLKLSGIRPDPIRPLALINKSPFSPGEEAPVTIVVSNQLNKAETQRVNVRCLEIRRDSVLVSIAGESGVKELRIAQGK